MGFIPVTDLPCTVLNPIPHLDQYLIDLNSKDSLESFNQLADLVLANQPPCSPLSDTSSFSTCDFSPESSQWLSSSPSSSSSSSSLSPSNPSSPSSERTTFSPPSSFIASPFTKLELSGSSASSATSIASSQTTNSINRKTNCLVGKSRGVRQIKNASAAEKYRKKIKGSRSTLLQQMDKEQERNERLKRTLKLKLSLYREFITLLAQNTTQLDRDLANLGFKSLSTVLSDVCKPPSCSFDEELRAELETQLNTFQQIL